MTIKKLLPTIDKWHSQNISIVLVTGVFDLLHIEHIQFLQKAKNSGDKLVVGIESDLRVRQIKGPDRPINSQLTRLKQLNALKSVDLAFILPSQFNSQASWQKLIRDTKPNIYAVSSHTSHLENKRKIVETYGCKLKIVHPHHPEMSTSLLIAKLVNPHLKDKPKYSTSVIAGFGRGKLLGYPTLNMNIPKDFPYQHGIYAGWIWLNKTKYQGAFHFGPIPTFNHHQSSLEVFLLDRQRDIKTKTIKFQLLHYLRPIKHFDTPEDLTQQITLDVSLTQTLLKV